ncbi:MAG: type IV secretory system conjugative DNA transfer family protein, partial [Christensenellaceae bacterium]
QLISCCNTFDFDDVLERNVPVAIFLAFPDEVSTSYIFLQFLVNGLYERLIAKAYRNASLKLERPFWFILDEFGNVPAIPDFSVKISACRSREIWFMVAIQSYAQLVSVYGESVAEIVMENLNTHVFFGSGNYQTKELFSRRCGENTRYAPAGALNGRGTTQTMFEPVTQPAVTVSELGSFAPGQCIVSRTVGGTSRSFYERSYLCPEMISVPSDPKTYHSEVFFCDEAYEYIPKEDEEEF